MKIFDRQKTSKEPKKSFTDSLRSAVSNLMNRRSAINTNVITSQRLPLHLLREINRTGMYKRIISLKTDGVMKNNWVFKDEKESAEFYNKHKAEIYEAVQSMFAYGRGLLVIVSENEPSSTPLNPSNLVNGRYRIKSYTGDMITAQGVNFDVSSERYHKPDTYYVQDEIIHHSRVVDFTYIKPPELIAGQYHYGGMSEAELIYPQLISDGVVERAASTMLEKSSSIIYKMKDFRDAVAKGKADKVISFINASEDMRSVVNSTVIDSEDDIVTVDQQLNNLPETNKISLQRIAMISSTPYSILLGEGSPGFGTSAAVEKTVWNETLEGLQERYVIPKITEFMAIFGLSAPERKPDQNITALEKVKFQKEILGNIPLMTAAGLDTSKYLSDNGFIVDENAKIEAKPVNKKKKAAK